MINTKKTYKAALFIIAILYLSPSLLYAQNHVANWDSAEKATVIVYGDNGKSKGTGFVWPEPGWIVTSLHVVANCKTVQAKFHGTMIRRTCTISKILLNNDLALLRVQNPPNTPSFTVGKAAAGQKLHAFGYRGHKKYVEDIAVRSPHNNHLIRLRDILEPLQQKLVIKSPILDLDIQVISIQGHLRHGISGAPILNHKREVVAICAGGINEGKTEECYAIPSKQLKKLFNNGIKNRFFPNFKNTETLMAFSGPLAKGKNSYSLGEMEFFYKKTLSLNNLIQTVDDPLGTTQLVQILHNHWVFGGKKNKPLLESKFDIYEEESEGLQIALPTNLKIKQYKNHLSYSKNRLRLSIHSINLPTDFDIIDSPHRNSFLIATDKQHTLSDKSVRWQHDPNMQYRVWLENNQGAVVFRSGFLGLGQQTNRWGRPSVDNSGHPIIVQKKYIFRTFAAKNKRCLLVTAKHNTTHYSADWALFVLGTQMSGFGIANTSTLGQ